MSAADLPDNVRGELNKLIGQHAEILADNSTDDLGQMRHRQGIIFGLTKAEEILSDTYRAMNG